MIRGGADSRGEGGGQGRPATARRTRVATETGSASSSFVYRYRVGNVVIGIALAVAAAQLFSLQVPRAAGLREQAASQLKVTDVEKAVRGAIVDRNFDKLAFTTEARTDLPARQGPASASRGSAEVAGGSGPGPAVGGDRQRRLGETRRSA